MDVASYRDGNVLSVDVKGRIDGLTAVVFEETVQNAIVETDCVVIMDFERLAYINSAGMRVILLTAKSLQSRNAKLVLCALSDSVREVFEISGFDKFLSIHGTRDEAQAAVCG